MASYRYKFLGKQQLPSKMTEAEAIEHCRLSYEQLAAIPIVSRVDDDGNAKRGRPPLDLRLGYALQLMFLGLTGRLAGVTDSFPANMVKVLANQLGTDATAIATIKSIYRGRAGPQAEGSVERRLREQRTWARQTLGFEVFSPEIERELAATLTMRARDAASQAELVTFAEEWLYEAQDRPAGRLDAGGPGQCGLPRDRNPRDGGHQRRDQAGPAARDLEDYV